VVVWELPVWSPSVRRLGGAADGRPEDVQQRAWRRLVVLGSHSAGDGSSVPGMVAQWWGWPHRAGGDGGDALHWSDVTAPFRAGAWSMYIPLSRVPLSSFEGCDMKAV
jgi:hypothetical protein